MNVSQIITKLKAFSDKNNLEKLRHFGIDPKNSLGVSIPNVRVIAKEIGKNHDLALLIWDTGIREARILASMIAEYKKLTEKEMNSWVNDFDSWDVCDQVCSNLFRYSQYSVKKCLEWSLREEEFVKRAGFALMASLSIGKIKLPDQVYIDFLPVIVRESCDERNFVKKAVNWALRQIGKRNLALNKIAISTATNISTINSKCAKWVAKDALREFNNKYIRKRF